MIYPKTRILHELCTPNSNRCALVLLGLRLVSSFLISGLPKKEPQHPLVKDGCPKSWVLFMGLVYTFTYFTTATLVMGRVVETPDNLSDMVR